MGNVARIKLPRATSLQEYHSALGAALQATFGDALTITGKVPTDPSESGVWIQVGSRSLCQWFYESATEWSVDHRLGSVGYWVAERMWHSIAEAIPGCVVLEDSIGVPEDLSRVCLPHFTDYMRREYGTVAITPKTFDADLWDCYGGYFHGPLKPCWSAK